MEKTEHEMNEKDWRIRNLEEILNQKIHERLRKILPLKITVPFYDVSELVQEKLIELGCRWIGNDSSTIRTYGYIYVDKCGIMWCGNNLYEYREDKNREVGLAEFLNNFIWIY